MEYKDISPILVKTLVCTEDERFYKHFGIDFEGVFAAAKDYVAHGTARGASTITQQLVQKPVQGTFAILYRTLRTYSRSKATDYEGQGMGYSGQD